MTAPSFLRPAALAFLAALLTIGAGCQRDPKRAAVSGQVLIDKEPLMEGSISFFPIEGTEGPEVGDIIKDGHYAIPRNRGVIVGKNKVVIRGFRNSGKKIPDLVDKNKMVDERVKAVGAEFNDKTNLTRDIQEGQNTLDFDLPGIK
jgi:hypothetical protein